jgi:uncharacterized protein (TIGR03437 family)
MPNRKKLLLNSCLAVLAIAPPLIYSYEYGPDPGYTGAPGDNPSGCEASGCHTSTPNTGGGSVKIVASGGTTYTPGQMQQIMVTIADPAERRYGFELTARVDSNPKLQSAGTLAPADSKTQLIDCKTAGALPFAGSCPSGNTLQWIEHTLAGYTASSAPSYTYTFNWTPPAANAGTVTLYAAGNAGSGALVVSATHTYVTKLQLSPGTGGSLPTITSVNSATDFGALSTFASGSWLEIKGTGLAKNTRIWAGADFTGSNAPIGLDGTSATINGKAAFMYYISPTQINVQAPADSATGSGIPIVVTAPSGTASASGTKAALAPGLLAPASFNIGGKQYLVAQFSDGVYVGNPGLISGVAFRPAKPGDAITVYGVGFGDVTPAIAPGIIVGAQNSLVNPVSVQFGTAGATLTYQGLSPSFVGLYQFNIVVPAVADGDYAINVSQNGVALAQKFYLTVHN